MGRRGILPSLGAGTSLIVAGVLCLVVISSIIAFRGLPGLGPEPARPPVRLAVPAAQQSGGAAPAAIVLGAGTGTAPARLVPPARRSEVRVRSAGPTVRIDTPSLDPSPITSPAPDPIGGGGAAPPAATPAATQKSPEPAARPRPVKDSVDRVRTVRPPVDPPSVAPAAQPVSDQVAGAVGTANGLVDQGAGVADDVVGGVLP